MELPVELHNKIVEFLTSLPNVHDSSAQRAFINSASLDSQLKGLISYSGSPAQFFQLLVSTLMDYGKLEDGRDALEAVLDAARNSVGKDRREYCNRLIHELQGVISSENQPLSTETLPSKNSSNASDNATHCRGDFSQTATATDHSSLSNLAQVHTGNLTGSTIHAAGRDVVTGKKTINDILKDAKIEKSTIQINIGTTEKYDEEDLWKQKHKSENRFPVSETHRNLDSHILQILYTYYEQHLGDPQMHFNELVRFTGVDKRNVLQYLYKLRQKQWVEYELTEDAESGLIWLTPLGIKVAKGK